MRTLVAATLAVCGSFIALQSNVQARNLQKNEAQPQQHHSGTGKELLLGGYNTFCFFMFPGAAGSEMRNVTVNGQRQQVVHLRAQGGGANAQAFVENLDLQNTIIASPISFRLVSGSGKSLLVIVKYTPPGQTEAVQRSFVTPNTVITSEGNLTLLSDGQGGYAIPVGNDGLPVGAQLNVFEFLQLGAANNCSKHVSNINHLQINRRFIGISADPSDSCEHNCDTGSAVED